MKLTIICLVALLGFGSLYSVWKMKSLNNDQRTWLNLACWVIILFSTLLMVSAYGFEYGLTYALFGLSLLPLSFIFLNIETRQKHFQNKNHSKILKPSIEKVIANTVNFIIVIPVAMSLSLISTLLISQLLPWQTLNQLTLVVIAFPCLWAIICYTYLYSEQRKHVALKLSGLTFALTLLTFL